MDGIMNAMGKLLQTISIRLKEFHQSMEWISTWWFEGLDSRVWYLIKHLSCSFGSTDYAQIGVKMACQVHKSYCVVLPLETRCCQYEWSGRTFHWGQKRLQHIAEVCRDRGDYRNALPINCISLDLTAHRVRRYAPIHWESTKGNFASLLLSQLWRSDTTLFAFWKHTFARNWRWCFRSITKTSGRSRDSNRLG